MKPIDYIYKNIDCLNTAILKQLIEDADENVSENIYDYLMETTWNTNPSILKEFGLDVKRSSENKDETNNVLANEEGTELTDENNNTLEVL